MGKAFTTAMNLGLFYGSSASFRAVSIRSRVGHVEMLHDMRLGMSSMVLDIRHNSREAYVSGTHTWTTELLAWVLGYSTPSVITAGTDGALAMTTSMASSDSRRFERDLERRPA